MNIISYGFAVYIAIFLGTYDLIYNISGEGYGSSQGGFLLMKI